MTEIVLQLPELTDRQSEIAASPGRFTVVAGGKESGKLTLALDIALTARYGALRGHPVALVTSDKDKAIKAQRGIIKMAEKAVVGRSKRKRLDVVNGGRIDFFSFDEMGEAWDQYATIVVLDCHLCDYVEDLFEDTLRPLLSRYRGDGWFFGKASGKRSGFWRLYSRADVDSDWRSYAMPSWENPHLSLEVLAEAAQRMPEDAFEQEYGAVFHDMVIELTGSMSLIGPDETFLQWCDRLANEGLKVDGHPFRLDNRPAMRFIYEMIPSTVEQAYNRVDILMKCAQVGFTVMEMLAMIYMALKFAPAKIGMYLPDMKLAAAKSSERFMPVIRTIPDVYRLMVDDDSRGRKSGEGNVMIRNMGPSRFHFLWTSGRATTESFPMDVLSFDEVQEMSIADMEKTRERLSASAIRYTLMGSTANWPDRDIHYWYKRGKQYQFHTECPHCGTHQVLDEHFPACIKYDDETRDYRYVCFSCSGWIDDPQRGEWRAKDPEARLGSIHFPQFLSPTITPREIIEAYYNADDMKNFYNRKLGKPYTDPSQVPINLEMLNARAAEGMAMGVVWKERATGTFMGIDQMGAFNVVLIAERLATGHMAIIHAELIYDTDPFARCDVLLKLYGVSVCVVETLPNYNDAKRFANRNPGIVFLAGYADIKEDMLRWGDAVPNKQERKTDEAERDRYTVTLDQYKCMDVALSRIQEAKVVFPDPQGLVQTIIEKGEQKTVAVLKDVVFLHLTRTALVAEQDEEEKKFRRRVLKVGIDPHFSYAYMLLSVAWVRAHGKNMFILPQSPSEVLAEQRVQAAEMNLHGLPVAVVGMMASAPSGSCGRCVSFEAGLCLDRGISVTMNDPGCQLFIEREVSL